jgi:alanine racemase
MADFLPFTREALLAHGLTPVLHSLADLVEFDKLAAARGQKLRCHLKVDTGMGRLGERAAPEIIAQAIAAASHVEVEGLMTHFASAGNYQTAQTDEQIAQFDRLVEVLSKASVSPVLLHLSSTIPVAYLRRRAWRAMVRPGHAVYGYVSPARGHAPHSGLEVKPALTWRATVLSVKNLPAGSLVGYGGMFRASRDMRLAVLAAGYADGIPHRLSNRGSVLANGKRAPIVGAVSMDLTSVDITESPELQAGDAVTLLGSEGSLTIDAQEIARLAGTISYGVLCGIHARVKRIYVA